MKPIKKTLYTLLLLSLFTALYFFSCEPDKPTLPGGAATVEQITHQREKITADYQHKTQKLHRVEDSLQEVIQTNATELQLLRRQVKDLKFSVTQKLETKPGTDTAQMVRDCEELKMEVAGLIQLTDQQDSICNTTISQLETLTQVKDTLLDYCNQRITQTDSLFNQSLKSQIILEDQLRLKTRELKKKRTAVGFLSAGLLLFSTASLTLLLIK